MWRQIGGHTFQSHVPSAEKSSTAWNRVRKLPVDFAIYTERQTWKKMLSNSLATEIRERVRVQGCLFLKEQTQPTLKQRKMPGTQNTLQAYAPINCMPHSTPPPPPLPGETMGIWPLRFAWECGIWPRGGLRGWGTLTDASLPCDLRVYRVGLFDHFVCHRGGDLGYIWPPPWSNPHHLPGGGGGGGGTVGHAMDRCAICASDFRQEEYFPIESQLYTCKLHHNLPFPHSAKGDRLHALPLAICKECSQCTISMDTWTHLRRTQTWSFLRIRRTLRQHSPQHHHPQHHLQDPQTNKWHTTTTHRGSLRHPNKIPTTKPTRRTPWNGFPHLTLTTYSTDNTPLTIHSTENTLNRQHTPLTTHSTEKKKKKKKNALPTTRSPTDSTLSRTRQQHSLPNSPTAAAP